MTDDRNVYLTLRSAGTINPGFGDPVRPSLIARCAEKKLSLFIAVGTSIDADYGETYRATGRYRYDAETAQRIRFGISDSREAVFLDPPRKWMSELSGHASAKLTFEVPTYRRGNQVIVFDLAGSDVALQKVLQACKA